MDAVPVLPPKHPIAPRSPLTFDLMSFPVPAEPAPIPSVASEDEDEESFVVLGHSMTPEDQVDLQQQSQTLRNQSKAAEVFPVSISQLKDFEKMINDEISKVNNSSEEFPNLPSTTMKVLPRSISKTTINYDSSYGEVHSNVEELIRENDILKNTINQINMSMRSQYEKISAWQREVQQVCDMYKNKLNEAKSYIDKLKEDVIKHSNDTEKFKNIKELQDEEILFLKQQLKDGNAIENTNVQKTKQELMFAAKVKELEALVATLEIENYKATEELEKYKQRCADLEQVEKELDSKKESIKELEELNTTMHKANEKREKVLCEEIKELTDALTKIRFDFDQVTHLKVPSIPTEEFEQVRQQLMNAQIKITELEDVINKKDQEVENIQQSLSDITSRNDEAFALKSQLELYKADYEAEAIAKNTLRNERDQIAEDLQALQRRNQQLQEEVELLREHSDTVICNRPSTSTPNKDTSFQSNRSPIFTRYTCPLCNMQFRSLRMVEEHAETCVGTPF